MAQPNQARPCLQQLDLLLGHLHPALALICESRHQKHKLLWGAMITPVVPTVSKASYLRVYAALNLNTAIVSLLCALLTAT